MRSGKANHEQQQYDDDEDDFSSKKEGPSSDSTNNNITTTTNKEGKSNDQKANAVRSKHSVTEQRRRSKINERFQILRDLIPHSDQKRDTASFLVEVIEYVRYLQEKVQKYEGGPYQSWNPEPTKLMPWRNSHLRGQSLGGQPQPFNTCSVPGPTFSGTIDESNIIIAPAMFTNAQASVDPDLGRDATCRPISQLQQLANKGLAHPLQRPISDAQSSDNPSTAETLNQHGDLMIEGGTISISSGYSQELLNNLTQALQNAGVDLSHANISVQVDIGKRANKLHNSETHLVQNHENLLSSNQTLIHPREVNNKDSSDQANKRMKMN